MARHAGATDAAGVFVFELQLAALRTAVAKGFPFFAGEFRERLCARMHRQLTILPGPDRRSPAATADRSRALRSRRAPRRFAACQAAFRSESSRIASTGVPKRAADSAAPGQDSRAGRRTDTCPRFDALVHDDVSHALPHRSFASNVSPTSAAASRENSRANFRRNAVRVNTSRGRDVETAALPPFRATAPVGANRLQIPSASAFRMRVKGARHRRRQCLIRQRIGLLDQRQQFLSVTPRRRGFDRLRG